MSLTCPYCDHEMEDSYDLDPNSSVHEWECNECGKTFQFEVEYEPIYYEWKTPCLNGEPHKWKIIPGIPDRLPDMERCEYCGDMRVKP